MFSILIVDDNADLVELFSVVLTRNGYKTGSAGGGEECLKLLKISTPDLILLDIMMDPMDGWETLTGIRSDRKSQFLPVIMVTGKQPTWDEVRSHMTEIDDYIVKPLTVSALTELVNGFFSHKQVVDEEIALAKASGADDSTLNEYRSIRRSLAAGMKMRSIIGQREEKTETALDILKERLASLQRQYRITEPY
jgi:two-component system OmpR family response regulator